MTGRRIHFGASLCLASFLSSAAPAGEPERALEIELTGPAAVEPGSTPADFLKATNRIGEPLSAVVEFSVQRDDALYSRKPPDPIYGSDHALGARSWTEVDGKVIEEGSLTDGRDWTSAGS